MDPEDVSSQIMGADQLYAQGRLGEAIQRYRDILEQAPTLAWAHSRIGAILAQEGDLAGAEAALRKAIELAPALPQAHSNLGNVYYALGDYEAALAKYQEAVALSPDTSIFHENLHAAYKKTGRLSDAIRALKQAHRLQRESAKTKARAPLQDPRKSAKGRRLGCLTMILLFFLMLVPVVTG